jgi:hypothetical protein
MRSLGEVPEPASIDALPQVALPRTPSSAPSGEDEEPPQSPTVLLARVAARIDVTVRPAGRRALPRWALPVLPMVGALIAALTGLVAAGLVTIGDTGTWGGPLLRGLGWLAFLVAPSAGVPVAAVGAHRWLEARLDIGGIGLTLLGGMVSATLMSLAFAATH